eukprot:5126931-Amphidinium_carterae.1
MTTLSTMVHIGQFQIALRQRVRKNAQQCNITWPCLAQKLERQKYANMKDTQIDPENMRSDYTDVLAEYLGTNMRHSSALCRVSGGVGTSGFNGDSSILVAPNTF